MKKLTKQREKKKNDMLAGIGGVLQKRIARQKILDQAKKERKAQERRV